MNFVLYPLRYLHDFSFSEYDIVKFFLAKLIKWLISLPV